MAFVVIVYLNLSKEWQNRQGFFRAGYGPKWSHEIKAPVADRSGAAAPGLSAGGPVGLSSAAVACGGPGNSHAQTLTAHPAAPLFRFSASLHFRSQLFATKSKSLQQFENIPKQDRYVRCAVFSQLSPMNRFMFSCSFTKTSEP
jgi:hypothetical protein